MNGPLRRVGASLDRFGRVCENTLLVLLLGGLIALAGLQIVQRNLIGGGFVWSDELLRILVLWLALFGAVAASRDDKHIHIDLLSRWLPPRPLAAFRVLVDAFTAGVCGLLAWHGGRFVLGEREFGSTALGGVPAWPLEAAIPLAFGLMAWRYGVFVLRDLGTLAGRGERP